MRCAMPIARPASWWASSERRSRRPRSFSTAHVSNDEGNELYYVVTGAAGFIGSNLVRALNDRGVTEIIAVDDLTQGDKFVNLADCEIADYLDKDDFLEGIEDGAFEDSIDAILHQGACSDTTE